MTREEQITMQYQILRNQLQSILLQKENYKAQKNEAEDSLKSIKDGDEIYKAVGMLVIKKNYSEVSEELTNQIEDLNSKIKALELREKQLHEKLRETAEKMTSLKNEED